MIEFIIIEVQLIITLLCFGILAYFLLRRQINETIVGIMELFTGAVTDPKVTRAMTILGKEGAQVRAEKATTEDIAMKVLSNPNIQGWKMIAKSALGIDLDEMIEDHGAVETLAGLKQLGDTLGIDIASMITQGAKGLNTTTESSSTTGFHLKG